MPSPRHILSRSAFAVAILATAFLASSCATKKAGGTAPATAAAKKKPEPKPSPSPTATPTPEPTPQARYIAKVSVEGGATTQQEITPANAPQATPSPTPDASPSPSPAPSPTPQPKSGNFLTQTWLKIFPPKPAPSPTPGATGGITVKVTTGEGGTVEKVLREGDETPPSAMPTPEPIKLKPRGESIFSRAWHLVFPRKELPPAATLPQWIGTIKSVSENEGYALIDSQQGYYAIAEGEILNSIGGGSESGVLRVTADRNPPFFIADIVGGKPRAGDRVYSPKP